MKLGRIGCVLLAGMLALTGCSAAVSPDVIAAHAAADLACALALSNVGLQIAAGVSTADALALISAASKEPAVAAACAGTLANLSADIAAGKANVAAKPLPKVSR